MTSSGVIASIVPLSLQKALKDRPAGISQRAQTLRSTDMPSSRRSRTLNVWCALGIVYVVWGSTYLAIAIAVQTLPPLLSAGLRFLLAGALLGAWLVARRGRAALRVERPQVWGGGVGGVLLLGGGNGLVVLAERTVPSGLTALVVAS